MLLLKLFGLTISLTILSFSACGLFYGLQINESIKIPFIVANIASVIHLNWIGITGILSTCSSSVDSVD